MGGQFVCIKTLYRSYIPSRHTKQPLRTLKTPFWGRYLPVPKTGIGTSRVAVGKDAPNVVLKIMWSLPNGTKIQYGSRNFCEKLDCFLYVNHDWSPEIDSGCIKISYLFIWTTIPKGPH